MKKDEINTFIEEMKHLGDEWTPKQVKDVYGKKTLEEALADRRNDLGWLGGILAKVLTRDK